MWLESCCGHRRGRRQRERASACTCERFRVVRLLQRGEGMTRAKMADRVCAASKSRRKSEPRRRKIKKEGVGGRETSCRSFEADGLRPGREGQLGRRGAPSSAPLFLPFFNSRRRLERTSLTSPVPACPPAPFLTRVACPPLSSPSLVSSNHFSKGSGSARLRSPRGLAHTLSNRTRVSVSRRIRLSSRKTVRAQAVVET